MIGRALFRKGAPSRFGHHDEGDAMKIRATTSAVYVPAGFFSLNEGEEYDVSREIGNMLVRAGLADKVEAEKKPAPRGKRLSGAPENKGD